MGIDEVKTDLIFLVRVAVIITVLILAGFFLTGCTPPYVKPCEPVVVKVQVPVACIEPLVAIPVKPVVHTIQELAAMPEYIATILVAKEQEQLAVYAEKASVLIEGCR